MYGCPKPREIAQFISGRRMRSGWETTDQEIYEHIRSCSECTTVTFIMQLEQCSSEFCLLTSYYVTTTASPYNSEMARCEDEVRQISTHFKHCNACRRHLQRTCGKLDVRLALAEPQGLTRFVRSRRLYRTEDWEVIPKDITVALECTSTPRIRKRIRFQKRKVCRMQISPLHN